jgi:hypothetical protein
VGIASGSITNAASSSTTGQTNISTGNNSGTGNSGNIRIGTGTVASGTRGIIQLDSVRVDLFSEIDMQSHKIVNLTDPSANQDAATKYYVDNALSSTGANRSLSNLIAPTAINESLLPSISLGVNLGAVSFSFAEAFIASIKDESGVEAFNVESRELFDSSGNLSIGLDTRLLTDSQGTDSINYEVRTLSDVNAVVSIDYTARTLYDDASSVSIDFQSRMMAADDASNSIDYQARELYSSDNAVSMAYESRALYDAAGSSVDWGTRQLFANDGSTVILDFSSNVGISANIHKITDVVDPTSAQDAATKAYVDSKIASGTNFLKQIVLLSATDISNGYIDLAAEHLPESTVIGVEQRVNLYETLDYVVSVVSSVTRVTFAGPSAIGGAEALEAGQSLYIQGVQA